MNEIATQPCVVVAGYWVALQGGQHGQTSAAG